MTRLTFWPDGSAIPPPPLWATRLSAINRAVDVDVQLPLNTLCDADTTTPLLEKNNVNCSG